MGYEYSLHGTTGEVEKKAGPFFFLLGRLGRRDGDSEVDAKNVAAERAAFVARIRSIDEAQGEHAGDGERAARLFRSQRLQRRRRTTAATTTTAAPRKEKTPTTATAAVLLIATTTARGRVSLRSWALNQSR